MPLPSWDQGSDRRHEPTSSSSRRDAGSHPSSAPPRRTPPQRPRPEPAPRDRKHATAAALPPARSSQRLKSRYESHASWPGLRVPGTLAAPVGAGAATPGSSSLPLFTGVRGRGVLGTSRVGVSRKSVSLAHPEEKVPGVLCKRRGIPASPGSFSEHYRTRRLRGGDAHVPIRLRSSPSCRISGVCAPAYLRLEGVLRSSHDPLAATARVYSSHPRGRKRDVGKIRGKEPTEHGG
jgi:hypothetical protein